MSWNDNLYLYAQKNGGTFFGEQDDWGYGWNGILLLEHKGAPMIVRCDTVSTGKSVSYTAQVLLRCQLERDYLLKITPKNVMRKGLNTVLGQLDKGAGLLNKNVDLYRDYGCPEVTEGRTIKTDDPEFTQMVFRDLELRNTLLECPKYGVTVRKSIAYWAGGTLHQITAWSSLGTVNCDWDLGDVDVWLSQEEKRQDIEKRNFPKKLDALIELAKAAHNAVTAWRMPAKKIDKSE